MSKTCVRRLMAGTVKPWTSPRPRAMYSSWMLAERAAQQLRCLPDDPARGLDGGRVVAEGGGPDDVADAAVAERRFVGDGQRIGIHGCAAGQQLEQLPD